MTKRIRPIFINSIKLIIAAGILVWMVKSGKLDFEELKVFWEKPLALVLPMAGWVLVVLIIGALRWYTLLAGIGLDTSFKRVVHLHWIGLFFNTSMPGAIGGDLIKAVYVIKDHREYRTKAMLTVILDRVLGLMGLFTLGGVMALMNLEAFLGNPALSSLISIVLAVCVGIIVFFVLVFVRFDKQRDPVLTLLSYRIVGFSALRKVYEALLIYKAKPWVLVQAWVLSIIVQAYVLSVLMYFTYLINGSIPPVLVLVPAIPVALLLTALPLAPAGLGVGHVAFAQVYQIAGAANGANVFNAYMLVNLCMNLTGIVAYVMFKAHPNSVVQSEEVHGENQTPALKNLS